MANLVLGAKNKRKSLVMWSGGLDSTYGLVHLLRETNDEVYAHHMHRLAPHDAGNRSSNACEHEAIAINKMRPYIAKNFREFHHSESKVDLSQFTDFAKDTGTTMFFAAQVAKSFGFTPADRILFTMNSDEDRGNWTPGTSIYELRRMNLVAILKLVWGIEDVPYFYLWPEPPSKQKEANYLPYELFQMTSSCREPRLDGEGNEITCGRCPECTTLKSVIHHSLKNTGAIRHAV